MAKEIRILKAEVNPEFFDKVKKTAKDEGEKVSSLVRRAVRQYINSSGAQK